MSQQLVTLDFETYYDNEYGLKKLTTEEYIRDPRFEVIGVGIKVNDNPTGWWAGDYASSALRIIDWGNTTLVAHHAHFDGLILSHHFGITPHRWIDTLSMARALHGSEAGGSLAALAERYGLGKKGHEVVDAKGKHLGDFTPEELHQYGEYCKNDVELTFALLQKLMAAQGLLPARFPGSEMKLIDLTVRMFTEPPLEIDAPRLQAYLDGEVGRKQAFLESANLTAETLRSKAKLAEVFRSLGVEPPTKVSAKTGKVDFAFAKTDKEFIALLDHDSEMVRAIAEARLGMSSNIGQTRSERLLSIGTRGKLPIYLKYYGAHTGRWSGSGSVNLQNMPRKSEIRKSIRAPEGHVIVVADSSQIEARTLAWVAGQHDLVQAFREDRRVYSEFASVIYERPITKADKVEDFVGKVCLGAATKVLTKEGWKPIIDITLQDKVWDGEEWVEHQGLVYQGVKPTLRAIGVNATSDHEILTEHGWEEWREVLTQTSLMQSAIKSASLPFWIGGKCTGHPRGSLRATIHTFGVRAGLREWLIGIISKRAEARAATLAPKLRRIPSGFGYTGRLWRTMNTVLGSSTAYLQQLVGATIPKTECSLIMASAASSCMRAGGTTAQSSWNISKLSQDGTTPLWRWIAQTITEAMSRGISVFLPGKKTSEIGASFGIWRRKSEPLRQTMPVYDLLSCGPRHRFTILSDAGPLIVHNCVLGLGYGLGHKRLREMLAMGVMGGPKLHFSEDETLAIVRKYRARNAQIAAYWKQAGEILRWLVNSSGDFAWGPMRVWGQSIVLPNGLALHYPDLRIGAEGEFSYQGRNSRVKVYGGLLVENCVQALARIIVSDQMLEVAKRGYKLASMTHDEMLVVVPEALAESALAEIIQIMSTPPSWALDLPVSAEGDFSREYSK